MTQRLDGFGHLVIAEVLGFRGLVIEAGGDVYRLRIPWKRRRHPANYPLYANRLRLLNS